MLRGKLHPLAATAEMLIVKTSLSLAVFSVGVYCASFATLRLLADRRDIFVSCAEAGFLAGCIGIAASVGMLAFCLLRKMTATPVLPVVVSVALGACAGPLAFYFPYVLVATPAEIGLDITALDPNGKYSKLYGYPLLCLGLALAVTGAFFWKYRAGTVPG